MMISDDEAKLYAAKLLSARPYSAAALAAKLTARGFGEETADTVVAAFIEQGYLDDAAYAQTVARHYTAKGYGRRRVEAELYRRGVDREISREAVENLPEPDGTLDVLAEKLFADGDPDERELRRFTDRMRRKGFDWQDIRDAVSRADARGDGGISI